MIPNLGFCLAFGLLNVLVGLGQSASINKPRYNNPPEKVLSWVALGDSFSAGPGAGGEYDPRKKSGHCMRRDQSYAPILQTWDHMIGPGGAGVGKPVLKFVACTGDTTENLLDFSDPVNNQLNQVTDDTTFVSLSIGGNDVLFADVLKVCVYGGTLHLDKLKHCEDLKADSNAILYGERFHQRYGDILDQLIYEKFRWTKDSDETVVYQTGYSQFFDDWTDQCSQTNLLGTSPRAPPATQELRRSINFMVHQLNEVLRYWIDLKNVPLTKYINKDGEMQTFVSPVHWVDMDWKYNGHRFCREGVKEPDRNNADTWFFHAPFNPFREDQKDNQTYIDLFMENIPLIWRPGREGEPGLDENEKAEDEAPFDPNNPVHLLAAERKVKTFHPTPNGFNAEAEELLAMLYRRNSQRNLSQRRLNILCIGDFSAFGEGYQYITPERYGFMPWLQWTLRHAPNFDNRPVTHRFVGSQRTGYAGDVGHEIYPDGRDYIDIAHKAASTREFQNIKGKVVPIMMGSKDIENQTPVDQILPNVHWLLQQIWKYDPEATVLLASVPMMGDPRDVGNEWYGVQKTIIEFNAQLAAIANYYATKENRRIVSVHLSAPQQLRLPLNPYIPNPEGYQRIASDFLNGMIQANDRHFFDGDRWRVSEAANDEGPSYDVAPLANNEVTNGIRCHQKRDSSSPDYDTITKSLFRGAKDQDDWINNYACNKTAVCKFTWDAESPDASAEFPFSNGRTCVTAGGDNDTHSTAHQFVVRREKLEDNLDDWCKINTKEILDRCVKDGEAYGGYWGDGKRAVYLSNVLYQDDDAKKVPSTESQKDWRHQFLPYEQAIELIKKGGPPTLQPGNLPDKVEDAGAWSPPKASSYASWDPNKPKGQPKSLQIVYENFIKDGRPSAFWYFVMGVPGTAVPICFDKYIDRKVALFGTGKNPPEIDVRDNQFKFRPEGYKEECWWQMINPKGPDGDVGWLHCPERPAIKCLEAPQKTKGEWGKCRNDQTGGDLLAQPNRIIVGYCDWDM